MWRGADDTVGWRWRGSRGPSAPRAQRPSLRPAASFCPLRCRLSLGRKVGPGGTRELSCLCSPAWRRGPLSICFLSPYPPECGATQPQPAQVSQACGERSRVPCGLWTSGSTRSEDRQRDGVRGPTPHTPQGTSAPEPSHRGEGGEKGGHRAQEGPESGSDW